MEKFVTDIIVLLFCMGSIYYVIKNIKRAESFFEKTFILLYLFVYSVPATLYILDAYNIPTKLNIFSKVNMGKWNDFMGPYITTIVGNIVSGAILLLITRWQIGKQIESNNEDKRIQNAPILKYNITNEYIEGSEEFHLLNGINKKTHPYNIFLNIENIGLNHARNFKIDIYGINNKRLKTYTNDNNQSIIKKDENIKIDLIIDLEKNEKSKIIKLYVFYDDFLKNKYRQDVTLNISASEESGFEHGCYNLIINSVNIKDEVLIKENGENNEKNNNKC